MGLGTCRAEFRWVGRIGPREEKSKYEVPAQKGHGGMHDKQEGTKSVWKVER